MVDGVPSSLEELTLYETHPTNDLDKNRKQAPVHRSPAELLIGVLPTLFREQASAGCLLRFNG